MAVYVNVCESINEMNHLKEVCGLLSSFRYVSFIIQERKLIIVGWFYSRNAWLSVIIAKFIYILRKLMRVWNHRYDRINSQSLCYYWMDIVKSFRCFWKKEMKN